MCSKYTNIALYYDLATVKALAPVRRRIAQLLQSGQSAGDFEDITQTKPAGLAGQHSQTDSDKSQLPENQPPHGPDTEQRKPCRVLDIGCGTGVQLEYLSMAGFDCAGVDESPEMLERAKTRCKSACLLPADTDSATSPESDDKANRNAPASTEASEPIKSATAPALPDCCLTQAPADKLPFADNSFDAAILSLILHESDTDPQKILAEAARVASRVLVLEWKMPERNMDYLYWLPMHIIERMAGKQHFRRFREYMRNGALEGMIYRFNLEAKKNGTAQLESSGYEFFRLGSLVLMDLRKIEA